MSTPAEARARLDEIALELDQRSKELADVERQLEPVAISYQTFVDDYEIGLWTRHEDEGAKLPSADLRLKLAHRAMNQSVYGRYVGLTNSRKRLMARIGVLKAEVEAQRSILSALKVELEASR